MNFAFPTFESILLQKGMKLAGCKLTTWPEKAKQGRKTDRDDTANNIAAFLNANVGMHNYSKRKQLKMSGKQFRIQNY